ncbi:PREDICTED: G-type lectin S-receptor-like serine/threonine-protein kinase At1g11330 isoform X2 [Tarenaya hassleriana]|uniref:G-type lectin S-receptor-like serine/threonine-protein kinase At1g11330 isoform X2 n=1 Tax=Tarenaya hassleriana TaxID=28532 RepID=UPI00053C263E|nr:PREDICTED: G-type lectin S-receptor-like serine/threonine-protein kinase At1g11330 isoform X2 [Tarenaya hassleriana]
MIHGFIVDRITFSTPIKDSETIVSDKGMFMFGFFSPVDSTGRYAGIWYNNIPVQTVVWVANKDNPVEDMSGVVSMSEDGNLVVMDGRRRVFWSTNVSVSASANSTWAQLLDTGNLVLQGTENDGEFFWESFRNPSDSYLPRMVLESDARTGRTIKITSWKSPSDPSPGNYTAGLAADPLPEVFIWKDGVAVWRTGPWNGQIFIGFPDVDTGLFLNEFALNNDNQGKVSVSYANDSGKYHFKLDHEGYISQKSWNEEKKNWSVELKLPKTECDEFGKCGQFASCNPRRKPLCRCIKGFEPKNYTEWNRGNWTSGCRRRAPLKCERRNNGNGNGGEEDGFLRLKKMKAPNSTQRSDANEQECPRSCLQNCSCTAYTFDRGYGCMFWTGSLFDMQEFRVNGIDLQIRLANSEIKKPNKLPVVVTIPVIGGTFIIVFCILFARRKATKRREAEKDRKAKLVFERMEAFSSGNPTQAHLINQAKLKDLPLFEFQVLAAATDDFALANKIGQGGFGPVYKGKMEEGQEIAVKRLSRASGQGLEELVNEVVVISKLQHRNLVRLLGCCIEGEERLLVYEFMPKKSLDSYLFDPLKQKLLHWKTRFRIMEGICRGLLYLHRDSRLRIIHRDLKPSNILLDEHLNPKISDFGLARIFHGNEDEAANTRRVVGTYGYMSPEYAMEGLFSEKSDVFSLGVILLEIISGRRSSSFHKDEETTNLLAYAWKLWNEGKASELADPAVYDEGFEKEIRRCVHISLLCVQELANDRPSVSTVIWMLSNENSDLPEPKQPAFIARKGVSDAESSDRSSRKASINNASITAVTGR